MLHWLLILLLSLSLTACQPADTGTTLPSPDEAAETVETEPAELPPTLFDDFFEARRALYRLEDIDLPLKYYSPESYENFRAVRESTDAAMKKIPSDGGEESQRAVEALYQKLKAARDALEVVRGDTPRVYIIKDDAVGWDYSPCTVIVVNALGSKYRAVSDTACEISLRGNSTSGAAKAPYNIRFQARVSLLGMERGRKWSLLANLYDKTMMRNVLAYTLAADMGLPYTSDCRVVEVYLNGDYQGNYTLIEPVTDGRTRVDIDIEADDFLFEVDMNRNDGSYYFKPKYGQRMKVTKPEKVSSAGRTYLKNFFEEMETALATHDMAQYGEYIDVDSFVNFYIHSEVTKSIDVYDFSTRYFLKDGKFYAGPVWDYDLSMGNVSETCNEDKYFTYCNVRGFGTKSGDSSEGVWMDNYWFHELLGDPAFRDRVRERFEEIFPLLENLYRSNELGPSRIDDLLRQYGDSFRRNYTDAPWNELQRYSGLAKNETLPFGEEVEWLRGWLMRRVQNVAFALLEMD